MTIDAAEIERLRDDLKTRDLSFEETITILDELGKALGERALTFSVLSKAQEGLATAIADRDSARALLREALPLIAIAKWDNLRARIAAELGDKP